MGSLGLLLMVTLNSFAQNSVLVNFGSSTCSGAVPSFSLIGNPLGAVPNTLAGCGLGAQLPNYYSVFIAYNPSNNKIYVADVRTGARTDIWLLDVGLPTSIACPPVIPVSPTYSYSYTSNNFEFDNNGDLWSFSNYNPNTGQCNIDKFDVNTGNVLSSKVLQFPAGNFPTTIASGDLTILPNGRMFAVLGNGTCRLYEITNYNTSSGNAVASFLRVMPKDCYGICYLNGLLELTGMDFGSNCYYYDYDIVSGTLGSEKPFQNGQAPIDNTSFTPSLGCTKKLVSAARVNSNTADLVYEIYLENLGNVILNNVNINEDLSAVFGNGNVSNVSAQFLPGANAAGISLNPAFNGTTVKTLFNPGQQLPNKVRNNPNYFVKLQVACRATNLSTQTTYLNSAIASAQVGAASPLTTLNVADSSNNGDSTFTDPNKNGNSGDAGEDEPTPFSFGALPVKFLQVNGTLQADGSARVRWQVATPMENADLFDVEFSRDGRSWQSIGTLSISNYLRGEWEWTHPQVPTGRLYYRIRQVDKDGTVTYSRIVVLSNQAGASGILLYPNPAGDLLQVLSPVPVQQPAQLELYDAAGRLLLRDSWNGSTHAIPTHTYPNGTYFLKLLLKDAAETRRVIIRH